jgi:hypothetical protein
LYFTRDLAKGEVVSMKDMDIRSPAAGIDPVNLNSLVGKVLNKDVHRYEIVSLDLFN